ncbi:MAG TPA: hypothetical protein VMV48_07765, partial [Gallionellaceae bacterium]|nr:hypothetical protein [Gallionellaceae bacterium]
MEFACPGFNQRNGGLNSLQFVERLLITGPATLAISVKDIPKEKNKLRLLKSGDLAFLLDVLIRRLSEGLDPAPMEPGASSRSEEEQVDKEGDDEPPPQKPLL